jgi:hypothetical protein
MADDMRRRNVHGIDESDDIAHVLRDVEVVALPIPSARDSNAAG